jgi:putative ABC transport system substrate-binding protein
MTVSRQQKAARTGERPITRRIVFSLLLTVFLLTVSFAEAGQPKVYRIGVLYLGGPLSGTLDGLRGGLRELGLAEGKQFTLAILDTKGDAKAAEEAARNFEREKFDLIYALNTPVVTPAKAATTNIPIVFVVGTDPSPGDLWIASLSRAEGSPACSTWSPT